MDKCLWCGKTATHYCDAPIGFEATGAIRNHEGNVTGLLTGGAGQMWTCDAPMCDEHVHHVGIVCAGKDTDSIDHCPHHHEHPEPPMRDLVMFEHEAESKRRQVHSDIRRERMRHQQLNQ